MGSGAEDKWVPDQQPLHSWLLVGCCYELKSLYTTDLCACMSVCPRIPLCMCVTRQLCACIKGRCPWKGICACVCVSGRVRVCVCVFMKENGCKSQGWLLSSGPAVSQLANKHSISLQYRWMSAWDCLKSHLQSVCRSPGGSQLWWYELHSAQSQIGQAPYMRA